MSGKKSMKWKGRMPRNEIYNLFFDAFCKFCYDTNKHFPKLSSSWDLGSLL